MGNGPIWLAFGVALAGAAAGLWVEKLPSGARAIIPFSGGLMVGVTLFGLLPELAGEIGWWRGLPMFALGYFPLQWLDRRFHAHGEARENEADFPPEMAWPLLLAAAAHAFLDGWSLANAETAASTAVKVGFPAALMLHKGPEGLALAGIFRAILGSRWRAFAMCVAAEAATLFGGWAGGVLTARVGSVWTNYPLALAGGCFLYLGFHAVEGEWRKSGRGGVWIPASAGLAGAAAIQWAARGI